MNRLGNQKYQQYTKNDGILALLLFGVFIILYSILAILEINIKVIKDNIVIVGCILNGLLILGTMLFIKIRKQGLDSIGLYNGNWKKSCLLGMILGLVLFFNNCGIYLLQGKKMIEIHKVFVYVIYFFLVSLSEEMAFRGYMNTRISGIIKKQWVATIVVGLLFTIMHFPYRMIAYGMSFSELTIDNMFWLIDLFITHIVLSFIYLKTKSLYGAVIPHWISNLANTIVIK